MRTFEFDVINVKKLAKFLVDYEFNFEVDFVKNVVRISVDDNSGAINQLYIFLIDHYDNLLTLSDVLDSEIKKVKE
jgi:hypothetical protein